ncbi:MAG: hypothetical protein ACI4LZ_02490 [Anaerovoracaceae bacterium]
MKNKVLVIALALVLVFSFTAAAFADSGIQPYRTGAVTYTIERTSGTTASAEVDVHFTSTADSYSVVVYLQKLVNGVWKNDNTNPEYVFYNNGSNSNLFIFVHNYTSLQYGTSYRLMVVSRDVQGSNEYRATTYSNLF